jgi:hypothetical protein
MNKRGTATARVQANMSVTKFFYRDLKTKKLGGTTGQLTWHYCLNHFYKTLKIVPKQADNECFETISQCFPFSKLRSFKDITKISLSYLISFQI